ncbi:MAG: EAL domain-containing protein [Desulfofustis sp.]|nr:EAL domain-containing protein [Desulfofustis sp.]
MTEERTSRHILPEQTRLLYENALMPIIVSTIAAAMMVLFLWNEINQTLLLVWLATFISISTGRIFLLSRYRHRPQAEAEDRRWHGRFLVGNYAAAFTWGISSFLIFPTRNLDHQIVYFMIMVGMAAGGVSSLCPSYTALSGFLTLILFPMIAKLCMNVTFPDLLKALLVFLFWLVTMAGGRKINSNIRENIKLRRQSANREQSLKISEERYRHLFGNAPLGIMQYDGAGVIIDCNEELVRILGSTRERLIGFNLFEGLQNQEVLTAIRNSIENEEGYFEGDYTSVTGANTTPIRAFFKTISHSDQQIPGGIAIIEDFSEKRQSEELIKYHASYDSLTGLPNRRLFMDYLSSELSRARRHHYYGALLYLDLDNFKTINDSLGHSVGDEFLKVVARRLTEFVRKEDVASRMGGDEFTVVITELGNSSQLAASRVRAVAEELSLCLSSPCKIVERDLQGTVSIGISLFPKEDLNVDDILKQADTAMYRAKAAGRNEICFFLPSMQEAADEKLHISTELRHALKQGELFLHFQPQVDITGALMGAEALLRWDHPQRGMMPPRVFIAIAEESGLMHDIGRWVLTETCRKVKAWGDAGLMKDSMIISVNISGIEIAASDFVHTISDIIRETRVDPRYLGLELTEGSLISTGMDIIEKMMQVRDLGVKFSVDDFGTGYSSLNYLKRLPINTLKIDRAFVNDIGDISQAVVLVDTIIMMATNLGLEVIAEGVETEHELHYLSNKGCFVYQGYYFSRPLPEHEFERVLAAGRVGKGGS